MRKVVTDLPNNGRVVIVLSVQKSERSTDRYPLAKACKRPESLKQIAFDLGIDYVRPKIIRQKGVYKSANEDRCSPVGLAMECGNNVIPIPKVQWFRFHNVSMLFV